MPHVFKMQEKKHHAIIFKSFYLVGNPCRTKKAPVNRNCRNWKKNCASALLETSVCIICWLSLHPSFHSSFLFQSVHLKCKWALFQEIYEIFATWNGFWQSHFWASAPICFLPSVPDILLWCHPSLAQEHTEPSPLQIILHRSRCEIEALVVV